MLCLVVVVLSTLLRPDPQQLSLFGWQVPGLCLWSNLTGWECFGCGLTRSFTYMGHLMLPEAWGMHKAGPFLWVGTVLQIPLRARNLWLYWREAVLSSPPRG